MNKLISYLSLALIMLTFISCSPDEEEAEQQSTNAQNQLKTIRIEAIAELPISPTTNPSGESVNDLFRIIGAGSADLFNSVPSSIGQNTIALTYTAAPSSNLYLTVQRLTQTISSLGVTYSCGDVTINVYSNNELFYTTTKEMGGTTCFDGQSFAFNVIVPM